MFSDTPATPIPVTVFTGFLGAGKTSIILSLLPQLPKDYRVVLLKNEFGDVQVDSQLARQSSLTAVSEILNGCMCCVLVGQMKTALLEILEKYHPDRIIIESSGSAFPATLAFQIRDLERETSRALALDAIVTVIDAENFAGYEDTSVTARMQAQYTDLLLINKWEHVTPRALDDVLEHLNTLNDLTPKLRCARGASVAPALVFGLDSRLFLDPATAPAPPLDGAHNDEVETATLLRGATPAHTHVHTDACTHTHDEPAPAPAPGEAEAEGPSLDEPALAAALGALSKESVYRVKGFVRLAGDPHARILNWAFGRWELSLAPDGDGDVGSVRLTVMGARGEVRRYAKRLAAALGATVA
ncbi:cobW-domain-containing protein [Gloeopeniophorella convolvens]|nr:cobW-domain-containing protein [Gloeopeniophorella convolvens]